MQLQEFRKQYPQYDDLSDKELADGLYKRFYSDIPVEDFYARIGFSQKAKEPPAEFAQPEPITGTESAFATAPVETKPKPKSVMEGYKAAPTPLVEAMGAPISRQEYDKILGMYNRATPQGREQMMDRTDYIGSTARAIDAEYAKFKPTAPSLKTLDPRREARVEQLMRQGANYEVANLITQQEMERGLPPSQATVAQEPSEKTVEALKAREQSLLGRAGTRAGKGIKQGIAGVAEAVSDLTGNTEAAKYYEMVGRESDTFLKQLGDPKNRSPLANAFENAATSAFQQAPGLIAGLFTGSAPYFAYMGSLVFGQEYADGKRRGLTSEEAALRAGAMAGAELAFERFGLASTFSGLRAAARGKPIDEIATYFGKALAAEVPAEMATTTTQFGIDKLPIIGLNQEATATDFVRQMADTVLQTILQTGAIGGASLAVSRAPSAIAALRKGEPDVTVPYNRRPSPTLSGESIPISGRREPTFTPEGAEQAKPTTVGEPQLAPVVPERGEEAPPVAVDEATAPPTTQTIEVSPTVAELFGVVEQIRAYDADMADQLTNLINIGVKKGYNYHEEDIESAKGILEHIKNKDPKAQEIKQDISDYLDELAAEEPLTTPKEEERAPTSVETIETEAPREPAPAKRTKKARAPVAPAEPPAPFNEFEQQEYDIAQRLLQIPGGKSFGEGILTRLQGPMRNKKPSTQETVDFANQKLKKFETPAAAEPTQTTNTLRDTLRSTTPRERLILEQYTKETDTQRQAKGLAPAGKILANTDIAITDINEAIRQAGFMPYDGTAIRTNAPKEIQELYKLGTIISAGGYSILGQRLAQDRKYKTFSPDKLAKLYEEQNKDLAKARELLDKLEETVTPVSDDIRVKEQLPSEENLQPENPPEVENLNKTIADKLDTMASGFLIGDVVRLGNVPGVVVGVEGNNVRFRADTMRNAKSYVKIPAARLELVSRPNTTKNISFSTKEGFGDKKMQFKIDQDAILMAHGQQMYGSSLAQVAIKELTQNAFDGVKRALFEGTIKKGKITVELDSTKRTVTVTDNGSGMSEETVDNALFTGEGSDKGGMPPSETSGGFGKAKYAFMLGVKKYYVNTVRDGKRIVVETDPISIIKSNFTAKRTVAPKKEHGTTTTVTIPDSWVDAKGKDVPIWFPYSVNDVDFFNYPLIHENIEIEFIINGDKSTPAVGANFPYSNYRKLKVNFDWGSADIYYGINPKQYASHHVLSSGVYQFSASFKKSESERIPFDIIVNVKPNVSAKDAQYPFTYERERFKPTHEEDIKALINYLAMIARGEEMKDLQENFKKIVMLPRLESGEDLKESSGKLIKLFDQRRMEAAKAAPQTITYDSVVQITPKGGTSVVINTKGNVIATAKPKSERNLQKSFQATENAPEMQKFMEQMTQDPKLPAFHSNINVDLISVGEPYGDPVKFFAELGTLLVEMKELIASSGMWSYDKLAPENLYFAGISIDKKYGGVHIKLPYKAVYINPFFSFGAKSLFGVREFLLNAMIHEIAHAADMSHGVGHNAQMIKVNQYLADEGMLDYFRDAILDVLVKHESTFSAMREEYDKSTTINIGKSLEDYEGSASKLPERSDRTGTSDEIGVVSTGERPGRGAGVRGTEADSDVEVGRGVGEDGGVTDEGFEAFISYQAMPPSPGGPKPKTKLPRVEGPISGKSKWRVVEEITKTFFGVISDALKGRTTWVKALPQITSAVWEAGNSKLRKALLFSLTLRQMADLTRYKFPQLNTAINIVDKMTSYRLGKLNEAQKIAIDWLTAQNKKPDQSRTLGLVMLDATINGQDPDKGATTTDLDAAWASLDPEFKEIYRRVRDYFYNNLQEMIRDMKKRALRLPKAERQEAIRKINEQFHPSKLVFPYFPLRRFGEYWFQVGKGNFKEFYEFESEVTRNLSRDARIKELQQGNAQQQKLAETVKSGEGISELFSKNLASTQILKDVQELIDSIVPPTGATTKSVQDVRKELQDSLNQLIYVMLPQQSMRKMFINRNSIQGASGDMLRVFTDVAVHSAYQSARFKYSEDFINNINKARDYVGEFFSPKASAPYMDSINELEARTKTILSAEDKSLLAKASGTAGSLVFFTMLSSPFTALLNTIGFAVFAGSKLGGKYGYAKASEIMLKNMGRYWATTPSRTFKPVAESVTKLKPGLMLNMQFPSIVEGGKLSPLLQRAADRFVNDGQINISLTNDIFDLTDRPSELYTTRYQVVKKVLGGLFHQSERANREVALLSAFELEYERLLNAPKRSTSGYIMRDANGDPINYTPDEAFEEAINEATSIAGLTLGDFSRQMKSRLFSNVPLSVILKFKQYAIMATYNYIRALQLGVKPFSKKEIEELRKLLASQQLSQTEIDRRIKEVEEFKSDIGSQSRKELAGILGVTFLFGGLEAMPFFWIVVPVLAAMLATDDEKEDELFEYVNWFRNWASTWLGGMSFARGPVSEIVGGSISERVSLDPKNMFYRDGRYSPDMVEGVIQDVIANAGPVFGMGVNWLEAIKMVNEGHYQRAMEKVMPALFAKPLQAYRLKTEGLKTKGGVEQFAPEDFSGWMIAMQAIGLQPEMVALKQKSAIEAKTPEQKVLAKEKAILDRLWLERDNDSGYLTAIERAEKFYEQYPELLPKKGDMYDKIAESFEKREELTAEAEALGGVKIDKRLQERLAPKLEYGIPKQKPKKMTVEEIRANYPQYDDMTDKELEDALRAKGLLK